jgi:hypothetical protein
MFFANFALCQFSNREIKAKLLFICNDFFLIKFFRRNVGNKKATAEDISFTSCLLPNQVIPCLPCQLSAYLIRVYISLAINWIVTQRFSQKSSRFLSQL